MVKNVASPRLALPYLTSSPRLCLASPRITTHHLAWSGLACLLPPACVGGAWAFAHASWNAGSVAGVRLFLRYVPGDPDGDHYAATAQ